MEDLLTFAVEAHGGMARWDAIQTVTSELTNYGALWDAGSRRARPES
jgi:hypothetical protein